MAQNEIAVVPDFHKRILFSDEAHFWLNGYVNKQNCRIWSEANAQVYVETPLHPEKLTVWFVIPPLPGGTISSSTQPRFVGVRYLQQQCNPLSFKFLDAVASILRHISLAKFFQLSSQLMPRQMQSVILLRSVDDYSITSVSFQVIYSQFGLAIHQNDHQARRRFVEWAQNEIAVVSDFHKRILFIDEAHFWLNGYVNKQNCRIWSEANPQVYVETPLHPEKLTVWCALWAGGILLQKR
ncbi:hypothetical protein TNCV_3165921 [Trichonephila clavipes]|uniref:Transposase n=1 Tax=Trichonephila clavipes TaxID=2585209 RepID=A0A8X6R987_TRICX|nr:hypothetical protein TNCV_3165921 [Trichonephila clavipes]